MEAVSAPTKVQKVYGTDFYKILNRLLNNSTNLDTLQVDLTEILRRLDALETLVTELNNLLMSSVVIHEEAPPS